METASLFFLSSTRSSWWVMQMDSTILKSEWDITTIYNTARCMGQKEAQRTHSAGGKPRSKLDRNSKVQDNCPDSSAEGRCVPLHTLFSISWDAFQCAAEASLCFYSNSRVLTIASMRALRSSSSFLFLIFSRSCLASVNDCRKVSKMPKNSSGCILPSLSPKCFSALAYC